MAKNVYLFVDTENVGKDFIHLLARTNSNWNCLLAYTTESLKLDISDIPLLSKLKCNVEAVRCLNGDPSALDFSLCGLVGISVAKRPKSLHIILTNDNGYNSALYVFNHAGYKVVKIGETGKEIDQLAGKMSTEDIKMLSEVFDYMSPTIEKKLNSDKENEQEKVEKEKTRAENLQFIHSAACKSIIECRQEVLQDNYKLSTNSKKELYNAIDASFTTRGIDLRKLKEFILNNNILIHRNLWDKFKTSFTNRMVVHEFMVYNV